MGRSSMQGTSWHYEYLRSSSGKNSYNCAYNNGTICVCKYSIHLHKKCVGKNSCEDFERCSFQRPGLSQKAKHSNGEKYNYVSPDYNVRNKQSKKKDMKKKDFKRIVELGDTIFVNAETDHEEIKIHVTDRKNPFFGKELKEQVSIKGEKYRISKIEKRKK